QDLQEKVGRMLKFFDYGDPPAGFNWDTAARAYPDWTDVLDVLMNTPSPERDAAIDAYNARLDRYAHYSRVAGWTMVGIGTGGVAVAEATGLVLASRGMLGAAEFFGFELPTTVGAAGAAGVSGNQLENEIETDEVVGADIAGTPPSGGTGGA